MIHNSPINRFTLGPGGTARKIFEAALIGSLYFLLSRIENLFQDSATGLPSIYLPLGFALALLLLNKRSSWPVIGALILLVNFGSSLLDGSQILASLISSLVKTSESIFIAFFLQRYTNLFEYFYNFLAAMRFILITSLGSAAGSLLVTLTNPYPPHISFFTAWTTNWFANGLGIILILPFIFSFHSFTQKDNSISDSILRKIDILKILEVLILILCILGSAIFLFLTFQQFSYSWAFRSSLIFPFLIWLGIRFDHRIATFMLLIICLMAVFGVQQHLGIFNDPNISDFQELQVVQIYLGVMIFTTHLPMTVSREYRRAGRLLAEKEQEFHLMFNESPLGMFQFRPGDKNTLVNPAMAKMFGYLSVEELFNPPDYFSAKFYSDQKAFVDFLLASVSQDGWVYKETTTFTKDQSQIICKVSVHRVLHPDGSLSYIEGFVEDITRQKKQNMLRDARSQLLEMSHYAGMDELLTAILDAAENLSDSQVGFFHFLDDDQVTLTLTTWSTRTARDYCRAEGKGSHYPVSKAGVWVDCIHQRKPVIHNDYASLTNRKGLPEGHAAVVRELVIPVIRDNKITAILGVGNKARNYDERDVEMVSQLADMAWEITGRIQAELKLIKNENLLRASQNLAKVGGWEYDPLQHELNLTDVLYDMLGIPLGTKLEPNIDIIKLSDSNKYFTLLNAFVECRDTFTPFDLEIQIIIHSREKKWLRIKAQAVVESDKLFKITGSVLDISEIKETQASLVESEEQLRLALDASTDGMWNWYPQDDISEYSQAYCRMLGYEQSEFPPVDGGFQSIVHPDDHRLVKNTDQGLLDNQYDIFEVEYRLLTKNKDWKWILCRGKAVERSEDGLALRVVGTTVDITERKRIEEMLRQANSRLEKQAEANRVMQELLVEQATHDALTGLYNRRFMTDSLQRELQRAERDGSEICVLMLDIDHFKQFNDKYGHDAGD